LAVKVASVLCVVLLLTAHARAQENNPAAGPSQSTFRSAIDVVALNVVVTDGQQKFVAGLGAGDFAVFEDGVRQEVSFFASSAVPLDLAILLDTSASMSDKMATVQQAAIGFTSSLRQNDRIIVVDIKDGAKIVAPLGEDVEAARQAILATSAKGGTALYNGLYLTIKDMIRQRRGNGEVRRQAIVLLSDGEDTTSLMSFEDVMQVAKESGIAIYTIQLKPKYDTPTAVANKQKYFSQSDYTMKAFAQETGARSFLPASIGDLAGVYASIAEELANQYSLGYTSKNPKRDGAYRRVVVRVSERPGTLTRTRSGYFAARLERVTASH
jgi:Ca-activated chloride channel family protein